MHQPCAPTCYCSGIFCALFWACSLMISAAANWASEITCKFYNCFFIKLFSFGAVNDFYSKLINIKWFWVFASFPHWPHHGIFPSWPHSHYFVGVFSPPLHTILRVGVYTAQPLILPLSTVPLPLRPLTHMTCHSQVTSALGETPETAKVTPSPWRAFLTTVSCLSCYNSKVKKNDYTEFKLPLAFFLGIQNKPPPP